MKKATILVVEDDHSVLDLLLVVLKGEGFDVRGASNGVEALQSIQKDQPQLVILDVNMPKLDGWSVLSTLRAAASTQQLPVLMCTNRDLVSDVEMSETLGATGYITKPFEISRLVAKVRETLQASA